MIHLLNSKIAVRACRIDGQLAGSKATRLSVLFLLIPLFALFNWVAYRETISVDSETLLSVALFAPFLNALGYLAMSPFIARRRGPWSPLVLILSYAVLNLPSELFKVLWLQMPWTAPGRELETGPTAIPVILTSALIASFWFTVANLGVNWLIETRNTIALLRSGQNQLVDLRDQASGRLSSELELLKNQIETSIGQTLARLTDRINSLAPQDPTGLVGASVDIREFCNQEVRAISRQIASQQIASRVDQEPSRNLKLVLKTILNTADVKPLNLLLALLVVAIPYAFNNAGPLALQVVLVGLAIGFGVVSIADKVRRRWFGILGWRSLLSGLLMYLVIAIVGTHLLNSFLPLFPKLVGFTETLEWLLPVILTVLWALIGGISGAQGAVLLTTSRLASQNIELQQETTRLQQMVKEAQQRAYRLLHGSVQGRLAAVSLALIAARDELDPAKAANLLHDARVQMKQAREDLSKIFANPESAVEFEFEREMQRLLRTWQNLLVIDYRHDRVSQQTTSHLLEQEVLSAVQESITNAYRHSGATAVAINLKSLDDFIQLEVSNDVSRGASSGESLKGTGLSQIAKTASDLEFGKLDSNAVLKVTWLRSSWI